MRSSTPGQPSSRPRCRAGRTTHEACNRAPRSFTTRCRAADRRARVSTSARLPRSGGGVSRRRPLDPTTSCPLRVWPYRGCGGRGRALRVTHPSSSARPHAPAPGAARDALDGAALTVQDEGQVPPTSRGAGSVSFYRLEGAVASGSVSGLRRQGNWRALGGSVELAASDVRTRFTLVLPAFSDALPFSRENERLEEPSLQ
jgi:hypothetical protein